LSVGIKYSKRGLIYDIINYRTVLREKVNLYDEITIKTLKKRRDGHQKTFT